MVYKNETAWLINLVHHVYCKDQYRFIICLYLGKSALHWAAAVDNVEAAMVLLQHGANRDAQDNKVFYIGLLLLKNVYDLI